MLFGTDNIVNLVLFLFSFLQPVLGVHLIMTVTHIIWPQFKMNNYADYALVFLLYFTSQPTTYLHAVTSPSWDTSNTPNGHEIPCILQNLKVNHYRVHNTPQLVNNPSHINPVYIIPSFSFQIYLHIHPVYTSVSQMVSFLLVSPHQNPAHIPLLSHVGHNFSFYHNSTYFIWHNDYEKHTVKNMAVATDYFKVQSQHLFQAMTRTTENLNQK